MLQTDPDAARPATPAAEAAAAAAPEPPPPAPPPDPSRLPSIPDLDLYLFNMGEHRRAHRLLGAHLVDGGVRFAVWAPNARRVAVVGSFNGWNKDAHPLERRGSSGATDQALRIGQHDRIVPRSLHDKRQHEFIGGCARDQSGNAFEVEIAGRQRSLSGDGEPD